MLDGEQPLDDGVVLDFDGVPRGQFRETGCGPILLTGFGAKEPLIERPPRR